MILPELCNCVSKFCFRCDRCPSVSHTQTSLPVGQPETLPYLPLSAVSTAQSDIPFYRAGFLFSFAQTTPFQQKNINQAILTTSFVADCSLCPFTQMLLLSSLPGCVSKLLFFCNLTIFYLLKIFWSILNTYRKVENNMTNTYLY